MGKRVKKEGSKRGRAKVKKRPSLLCSLSSQFFSLQDPQRRPDTEGTLTGSGELGDQCPSHVYKREGNVLYLTVRVLIADFGLT